MFVSVRVSLHISVCTHTYMSTCAMILTMTTFAKGPALIRTPAHLWASEARGRFPSHLLTDLCSGPLYSEPAYLDALKKT